MCETCDRRAVTADGEQPSIGLHDGQGDNPVLIDGIKCWRRIRFGGYITRRDEYNCDSIHEFHSRHREDFE